MSIKSLFKQGDKVLRVGTKEPIMEIRGNTVKGGQPYSIQDTYTCYWKTHEPHWQVFKETDLVLFIETLPN